MDAVCRVLVALVAVSAFVAGVVVDEVWSWARGPNIVLWCVSVADREVPAGTPVAPDSGCLPEDWEVRGYYRNQDDIETVQDLDVSEFEAAGCP